MQVFKNMSLVNRITAVVMVAGVVMALFFSPGAYAQSGNVYGNNQAQVVSSAQEGIVLQVAIKKVEPNWQSNTGGAAIGGLLGGLIANNVGDSQNRFAVNTIGATVGAFLGQRVAGATMATEAQEIVIGLKDPRTGVISRVVTVVQPAPFNEVAANDQVLLVNTNGTFRIIKRNYDLASR